LYKLNVVVARLRKRHDWQVHKLTRHLSDANQFFMHRTAIARLLWIWLLLPVLLAAESQEAGSKCEGNAVDSSSNMTVVGSFAELESWRVGAGQHRSLLALGDSAQLRSLLFELGKQFTRSIHHVAVFPSATLALELFQVRSLPRLIVFHPLGASLLPSTSLHKEIASQYIKDAIDSSCVVVSSPEDLVSAIAVSKLLSPAANLSALFIQTLAASSSPPTSAALYRHARSKRFRAAHAHVLPIVFTSNTSQTTVNHTNASSRTTDEHHAHSLFVTTCLNASALACTELGAGTSLPDCCVASTNTKALLHVQLAEWLSDHDLPLLAELTEHNARAYLSKHLPLVVLYLPVDYSSENDADGSPHAHATARKQFRALAQTFSFGLEGMCTDCQELRLLEPTTDCRADCARQVWWVFVRSGSCCSPLLDL
jgi:hypothetical protein